MLLSCFFQDGGDSSKSRSWIVAAGNGETQGPLFRAVAKHGNLGKKALAPRSIAKTLVKAIARTGGVEGKISPHSLHSGMCTQAAINGAEERVIARTTGHRPTARVRRYIRDADLFRSNASARLGLWGWSCKSDRQR